MRDKYFIDTNILIYTFDKTDIKKQKKAQEIVQNALTIDDGCISYQVIQEFINVATQKFETPLTSEDCNIYLTDILEPLCEVYSDIELYKNAIRIQAGWKYSFYDSLIISAALKVNCNILYSEDLQDGQRINDLKIVNPFILY